MELIDTVLGVLDVTNAFPSYYLSPNANSDMPASLG